MEAATTDDLRVQIVIGLVSPESVHVADRDRPCPNCGTTAWFGPRHFHGQEPSYFLCKWCGIRWTMTDGPQSATLALPVYHYCDEQHVLLTWHQFEGEPYRDKTWTCDCGTTLKVLDSLRPFPRFAIDANLIERPGG